MHVAWFIPIGFLVGTYGTIIGAGGGFIIVPLLMFLFPSDSPSMITAASLAVIFVNSTSGTIAYARMKRISYKTGTLFAAATIPGALLGSYLTAFIPRKEFGAIFGGLLVAVAAFLALSRGFRNRAGRGPEASAAPRRVRKIVDTVIDREGNVYQLSYSVALGMGLSLLIGCFSSLVGIGGGLIHVPLLTYLFGFPIHIATATSHFVLVFTSLAGVVEHLIDRTWPTHLLRDACLAIGVVVGAQLGARISRRLSTPWIVVGLAVALGLVGVRLLFGVFLTR
jgi:uncharacterized membrane protein YfcA